MLGNPHSFKDRNFEVAVRPGGRARSTTISISPSGGEAGGQLSLFAFEIRGSAEASELVRLLRSAAAMAAFIEQGGSVESWYSDAAMRLPAEDDRA